MNGTDYHFTYLDYQYRTYEDRDDDCIKLFHDCYKDGRRINMPPEFYNRSPYSTIPYDVFVKFVQTVDVFVQG